MMTLPTVLVLCLSLVACTDQVRLGERELPIDAAQIDGSNVDAASIEVDAGEPDAAMICKCCCEDSLGTCPKLCACLELLDCPAGFECSLLIGQEEDTCNGL